MRGKLGEDTKVVVMHRAQQLATTTITLGSIVDTQDYDEALVELNVGKAFGTTTLGAKLCESDTKSISSMTPIAGAEFDMISSSNHESVHIGAIKTKNYKRYLTLQMRAGGLGSPTIGVGASIVLSRSDSNKCGESLEFDLGD